MDLGVLYVFCAINVGLSLISLAEPGFMIFLLLLQFFLGIYILLISHPIHLRRLSYLDKGQLRFRKRHFILVCVYLCALLICSVFYGEIEYFIINEFRLDGIWLVAPVLLIIPQIFFYTYVWLSHRESRYIADLSAHTELELLGKEEE